MTRLVFAATALLASFVFPASLLAQPSATDAQLVGQFDVTLSPPVTGASSVAEISTASGGVRFRIDGFLCLVLTHSNTSNPSWLVGGSPGFLGVLGQGHADPSVYLVPSSPDALAGQAMAVDGTSIAISLTRRAPRPVPSSVGMEADGTLHQDIVDKFVREGGDLSLGVPFDAGSGSFVHAFAGGWRQDFQLGGGTATAILADSGYPDYTASLVASNGIWAIDLPSPVALDAAGNVVWPVAKAFLMRGGSAVVGAPYDNGGGSRVHGWGSGSLQDLRTPSGGAGAILFKGSEAVGHWLFPAAWSAYLAAGGQSALGFPTTEIHSRDFSSVFEFERGAIAADGPTGQTTRVGSNVARDAQGNLYPAILAEYADNRAYGSPYDNGGGAAVHPWGNGVVQDIAAVGPGGTTVKAALIQENGSPRAFVVARDYWTRFANTGGVTGPLGFPVGEATNLVEVPLLNGSQAFEHGTITVTNGAWTVQMNP
jgi:hypothetical protein